MSIRLQMVLLLIALSTVFLGTTWMMHAVVMAPAFTKLEQDAAIQNLDRCQEAVDGVAESVSTLAFDYGAWDDTCQFLEDRNQAYRDSNLSSSFHETTGNDLVAILTSSQEVVAFSCVDPNSQGMVAIPELVQDLRKPDSLFTDFSGTEDANEGLVRTTHGLMIVASRPVVSSRREGPIRGAMIMGRFLNDDRIAEMCERTHCEMRITALDKAASSGSQDSTVTVQSSIVEIDEDTLKSTRTLDDIHGSPVALLTLMSARPIAQQGKFTKNAAMVCSLIGVLLMLLGTGIALRLRVVEPLQTMASHAARVGIEDDLAARLNSDRTDEIGILARSFDHMVAHLAEARRETEESAHRAGMAEIASEVLHNVGNAVNTANCCVEVIGDRLNNSRLSGLEKATSLLSDQASNAVHFFSEDPRGPKLINYLVTVTGTLQKERTENLSELQRLQETIRHIRDAIASQQSHARKSDFRQRVDLRALLNETLLVNEALQKQCGVSVTINMPELPLLELNRSRVAQVLVNLEKNALLSMQSVPERNHVLTVNVAVLETDLLQIEVRDTGTGFTPEIHERLFGQGFTTRKEGSGLGLHYCVNVIREMGGDITAHSDGPGTGARFQITIPRAVPETITSSAANTETSASEVVDKTASSFSSSSSSHNEPVISGRFQEQYA
ncbi:MAG: HAMP domain-containing protein [Planctomycetota bacterium]|nr:MAG: HAMP domain-containing protein [Planctomycetota bacterium]